MNQTSAPSLVVPVLPPAGDRPELAADGAGGGPAPHHIAQAVEHEPGQGGVHHRFGSRPWLPQHIAPAVLDPLDGIGRGPAAEGGEGTEGGDQLDGNDRRGTDVGRRIGRHRRADAEAGGLAHDGVRADVLPHPDGGNVPALVERLLERHGTGKPVVIVLRLPRWLPGRHLHTERRVLDDLGPGMPGTERRRIDHRLEGGASLANRLDRAIVLAVVEIAPPDQREHLAGTRLEHHRESLQVGRLREGLAVISARLQIVGVGGPGVVPVAGLVALHLIQLPRERPFRRLLDVEIDRGVDPEPVLVEL